MSADPRLVKRCLVAVLLVLACDAKQPESPDGDGSKPDASEPTPIELGANTCMPEGLDAAKRLEVIPVPSGCAWTNPGTLAAPQRIADAEQLAAALSCEPGATPPSFDFAAHELAVAEFSMSPAFAGIEVVDDGAMVSIVERQRSPCPDDPRPMPMSSTIAWLIDKGAQRQHRTLACTLPPRCR